eukprot:Opistho-2@28923
MAADVVYGFAVWLQALPGWQGPLVIILLFIGVSFPMTWGYIVLNLGAGYLYGFQTGLATVVAGACLGSFVSFQASRYMCKDYVRTKLEGHPSLKSLVRVVEGPQGFRIIMLARLTPIPFGLQNALFSLAKIEPAIYTAATVVGLLPTQIVNTYIGTTLHTVEDVIEGKSDMKAGSYAILLLQIVLGIALSYYVVRRAQQELNGATGEPVSDV